MKKILIPIPSKGFDPTETAIPWKLLKEDNFEVVFATPNGKIATGDMIMITGKNLGIFKRLLIARKDARDAYFEMIESKNFKNPISYSEIKGSEFDALFLPGGHDKTVREYLESKILQNVVVDFFNSNKKVAAVCHGLVLMARSIDPKTNHSVLYNYKTTSLLKQQELMGYNLTKMWVGDYYLTYPEITVEDEVKACLQDSNNFINGPKPIFRDSQKNMKVGFALRDKNFISARWPGDIYNISIEFIKMLNE